MCVGSEIAMVTPAARWRLCQVTNRVLANRLIWFLPTALSTVRPISPQENRERGDTEAKKGGGEHYLCFSLFLFSAAGAVCQTHLRTQTSFDFALK